METSPVRPLHNIYFQQLLPLIDLKLRIGRALTTQTALSAQERDSSVIQAEWQAAVRELELGLELARTAACQRKPVEAQLLLTLGECVPTLKGAPLRFVQLENLRLIFFNFLIACDGRKQTSYRLNRPLEKCLSVL